MEGIGYLLKLLLQPTPGVIGFFNPSPLYTNPSIVTYQKFSTCIQLYEIDIIDYWIFFLFYFGMIPTSPILASQPNVELLFVYMASYPQHPIILALLTFRHYSLCG